MKLSHVVLVGLLLFVFGHCSPATPPNTETGGNDASGGEYVVTGESGEPSTGDGVEQMPGELGIPMGKYPIQLDSRGRTASLLLPKDEFDAWNAGKGFQNATARKALTKELYKTFRDSFDFIFFVMNNSERPATIPFGQLYKVSNDVKGIGLPVQNQSGEYGSEGKLKAVMQLGRRDYLISGPSLHELLHNWANFVLDTKLLVSDDKEVSGKPHWGISDVGGQLGGFDPSTFQEKVDGDPEKYRGNMPGRKAFGFNSNGGNGIPYSSFELYLMGLLSKDKVKPIRVFSGIRAVQADFVANGTFFAKQMKIVTIDDIIKDKGLRTPTPDSSQKSFRVLAIMLTSQPLTSQEWDDFDAQVARFSKAGDDGSRIYNFWEATRGLATLKMDELRKEVR